jgi:hypothetical protein
MLAGFQKTMINKVCFNYNFASKNDLALPGSGAVGLTQLNLVCLACETKSQ